MLVISNQWNFRFHFFWIMPGTRKNGMQDNIAELYRAMGDRTIWEQPMQKRLREIISKYTKYNGRRKPELLYPNTYSLINL